MKCEVCGKEFRPNRSHRQRVCDNPACRQERRRRARAKLEGRKAQDRPTERACSVCGVIFKPLQPKQTTCSNFHCKREAKKRRAVARYNDTTRKEKTAVCPICGRRYAPKRDAQKTCGSAACVAAHGKLARMVGRTCAYCGRPFKVDPNSSKKYCCSECADMQREERMRAQELMPDPFESMGFLPPGCASWYSAQMMPVT